MVFANAAGTRSITLSMNVDRPNPQDPKAPMVILAGLNTLNEYLCGEPYELPTS
ncbi:hypothetical protein [Kribbella sp. DT2]|uniref:hypothetical protein n=1 Tax=Kribbella sp. DT2 TaxID=3393427 RepID=UPI003CF8C5D0